MGRRQMWGGRKGNGNQYAPPAASDDLKQTEKLRLHFKGFMLQINGIVRRGGQSVSATATADIRVLLPSECRCIRQAHC